MIIDNYNRIHNYLRISLTDNCNLRCFYCMPEEDYSFMPRQNLMQAAEIEAIARLFVQEGVSKIRLTGGEPLVRNDFAEIIERLASLDIELTLTTNGTQLHRHLDAIRSSGIKALNISLDTLNKDRFLFLTRRDQFDTVWQNIQLALAAGLTIKVNVVVMKGVNEEEILDFIRLTEMLPLHVRFIEFMPFDGNKWNSSRVVTLQQILDRISAVYPVQQLLNKPHETAKNYEITGHKGSFAVISTMSAPFCSDCNRLRLTADGKMKNCLFSESETDLLTAFRNGENIIPLIHGNIVQKKQALGGQFTTELEKIETANLHNRSMISIGG